MLRIITDGAADMPSSWLETYGIQVLPLNVNFGAETYTQGQGFTRDDFYRLVREKKMIPTTSLPSIGQIKEFYRSIAQKGDTILSIHVSSKLSGTFATVQAAARDLADEFQVHVFDSLAGSVAQAYLAREARQLEWSGAALPEILRRLDWVRQHIEVIFTLDTLDYAFLSGRITALQARLASALKVKPIIVLRDGLLEVSDRVRTRRRSLETVLQKIHEKADRRLLNAAVVHAADPLMANELVRQVCAVLNTHEVIVADLSIPVAAHLGPGAIGIVAYPIEEE